MCLCIHPGLFLLTNTNGSEITKQQRSRTNKAVSTDINTPCSEAYESSSDGYDGKNINDLLCISRIVLA